MRSCRVMGVYSLLLFTNTLCFLQRGSPLISRSHVITRNQHGGVVRSRRLTTPIRESFLRNVVMMGKPSSPIPRNIKDTVSALRAAVQVCCVALLLGLWTELAGHGVLSVDALYLTAQGVSCFVPVIQGSCLMQASGCAPISTGGAAGSEIANGR